MFKGGQLTSKIKVGKAGQKDVPGFKCLKSLNLKVGNFKGGHLILSGSNYLKSLGLKVGKAGPPKGG